MERKIYLSLKEYFKIDFVYGCQLNAHIFKTNFVYMAANQMNLPPNQKQIKSPLITSDAVSCPVTLTIIKHQWGEEQPYRTFQDQTKISNSKHFKLKQYMANPEHVKIKHQNSIPEHYKIKQKILFQAMSRSNRNLLFFSCFVPCALLLELDKSISFYHSLTQFPLTTTALL